jgi:hypothetical protein
MSAMSWSDSTLGGRRHLRMLAVALLVGVQRGFDVLGRLAADHRHLVDLGEAVLYSGNAVAADTLFDLVRGCFRVGDDLGRARRAGRSRKPANNSTASGFFMIGIVKFLIEYRNCSKT